MKDPSGRNINGIGLGLVITKHLVQQYGGEITVVSNIGTGSCFKI